MENKKDDKPDIQNSGELMGEQLMLEMISKNRDIPSSIPPDKSDKSFLEELKRETPIKPKEEESLDGSSDLINGLEPEINQEDVENNNGFPCLKIYGGVHGSFELIEHGKTKIEKITEKRYPLPLDTDIIKINAYRIATDGDMDDVRSIGNMTLNATIAEFECCYDLRELPPLNTVQHLKIKYCNNLRFFNPQSRVLDVDMSYSGIVFLPKSLEKTHIKVDGCNDIEYIHPAIPYENLEGVSQERFQECRINYMLSDKVSDIEKRLYPIPHKVIKLSKAQLETLPECLAGYKHIDQDGKTSWSNAPDLIIQNCPNLKYIHPEINPKKITGHGLTNREIYRMKMMYLFKKLDESDPRFERWFNMLQAWKKEFSNQHGY